MRKWTTTCESMTAKILRVVETTWVTHLTPEGLRNGVNVDVEYVLRARLPLDRTTREFFADLTAYTTCAEYGHFMGAFLTMPDPKPDVVQYGELRARRSGGLRDVTYRAATSPVVLGSDSTGLARDGEWEPVVVRTAPAEDALTILESAPKTSGYLTKADIIGTTCADVLSEIVSAEREHFASISGNNSDLDLRAKHVAVTADMWRVLCSNFGQTGRSGAETLLRAMPRIYDVRVLTGRLARGMAFIY